MTRQDPPLILVHHLAFFEAGVVTQLLLDLRFLKCVFFSQEHMRCHTLTHPYRCVLCNKDLKQFAQPHEPCGTISSVVVRASPAMEALMGKLGPQAPPTSSAEEVGLVNPTLGKRLARNM